MGLRGGDLLALQWSNVLKPDGRIADKVTVTEKKTQKQRTVALQTNAQDALQKWQAAAPVADGYVFPNALGGKLTIQRLHQLINEWAEAAGVSGHFGTHTLRKTYGYHLRQRGVGIETLMKVFGHSSQRITLRYIGIEQDEIDEANLKLNL